MEGAAKLAPFNPSSSDVLCKCGELAAVSEEDTVFDLGCGDGRLLVDLAKRFGCKCVGVEYDERFVKLATEKVKEHELERLVSVRHMDVCKVEDLERATVIYMYLSVQNNEQLNAMIREAYDRGARIVSNMFSLKYLGEPEKAVLCDNITKLYLYQKRSEEVEEETTETQQGAVEAGAEEDEHDLINVLKRLFDPLKNPAIMKIFNYSMVLLGILLLALMYAGVGNIHIYILLSLSMVLFASVNWFFKELVKAVNAAKDDQVKKDN